MELKPGDKLGPYEILTVIGRGGMGAVWKARDPRLNRDVAIKVSDARFSDRFEREARLIAALNHPNICQIYDIGPDYIVMEYIHGVPPSGPLSPADALPLALGIAAALEAAHEKGITHRDLKPANILVTSAGIKLLDFGIALFNRQAHPTGDNAATVTVTVSSGVIVGTYAYMSPEQAQGKAVDARSDIFSFGVVLYELLSGKRAFAKDSAADTMAAIIRDEPAPLTGPAKLLETIHRCLRKLPAARFQTMQEVRAALEQVGTLSTDFSISPIRGTELPSIAVLPFANMSRDQDDEYFSDGLAGEILNLLTRIPGLKVIARTSAFAFKGQNTDIRQIAQTLGVRNILEGSVRRAGSRVRVTAQLIEAENGSNLWSERYDREMTDIFAVQDEIGQAISEALKIRLAPPVKPVNIEAWQFCLKGQYHRIRFTPDSLAKGKDSYEKALEIDPNCAEAYSGLAVYYYTLAALGMRPTVDVAPLSKAAADKALLLDPDNIEAHSARGLLAGIYEYDWPTAAHHHEKAMSGGNVPPLMRFHYAAFYLLPLRRVSEAIVQTRLALEADPLSIPVYIVMVDALIAAERYPDAIEYARRGLEVDGNFFLLWFVLGCAQLGARLYPEAIASLTRTVESAPWYPDGAWLLGAAYHLTGDHEQSQAWGQRFAAHPSRTWGRPLHYAITGDTEKMFEELEAAWLQRDSHLARVMVTYPGFAPYREAPRFQALLRRMNLA